MPLSKEAYDAARDAWNSMSEDDEYSAVLRVYTSLTGKTEFPKEVTQTEKRTVRFIVSEAFLKGHENDPPHEESFEDEHFVPVKELPDDLALSVVLALSATQAVYRPEMEKDPDTRAIVSIFSGTGGPGSVEFQDEVWAAYVDLPHGQGDQDFGDRYENTGTGDMHRKWTMRGRRGTLELWDAGNGWMYRIGGRVPFERSIRHSIPGFTASGEPIVRRRPDQSHHEVRVRGHRRRA